MCRFHLYRQALAEKSPHCREELMKALQSCRRDQSLSRLQAAKSMLLNLKAQLRDEPSPDLSAAIEQVIERLEATP